MKLILRRVFLLFSALILMVALPYAGGLLGKAFIFFLKNEHSPHPWVLPAVTVATVFGIITLFFVGARLWSKLLRKVKKQ